MYIAATILSQLSQKAKPYLYVFPAAPQRGDHIHHAAHGRGGGGARGLLRRRRRLRALLPGLAGLHQLL